MNPLYSFFKKLRLRQFLAVALAGILMLSTGCVRSDLQAKVPGTAFPKVSSQAQGGMNEYSDTDPRVDTKGASVKAKSLQDRVEKNINQKRADSVDQYVDNYRNGAPLGERTRRAADGIGKSAEDVKDSAQDLGRDLSTKAQRAAGNVKDNTQAAGRDAIQDTKQAAGKTSNFLQDKASAASRSTQRALDDAANAS